VGGYLAAESEHVLFSCFGIELLLESPEFEASESTRSVAVASIQAFSHEFELSVPRTVSIAFFRLLMICAHSFR
jgi:hypothetical protein